MALLALINCLLEMFDRFFAVRTSFRLLTGLRVGQRGLSMSGEDIGMSHLAMVNGLLGVRYGFGDMIFRSQRNLRYQKQSEAETQHGDDESTGHERILRLIYCFSPNSPFSTVRLTVVNHSRRRGLHWNLENVGIEKGEQLFRDMLQPELGSWIAWLDCHETASSASP